MNRGWVLSNLEGVQECVHTFLLASDALHISYTPSTHNRRCGLGQLQLDRSGGRL
jgi:hypothetical protein